MRPCPPPRSLESSPGRLGPGGSAGRGPWGHMCFLAAAGAVQGGGGPAPGGRPGDGSRGTASSSFPGWGQGADSLALTAIGAFPGLLGLRSGCWLRVRAVPSFHAAAWGTRGRWVLGREWALAHGGLVAGVDGRVDSQPAGARPAPPPPVRAGLNPLSGGGDVPSPPPAPPLLLAGGPGPHSPAATGSLERLAHCPGLRPAKLQLLSSPRPGS